MSETTNEPTFTGTPDQWWENATPITETEAADRTIDSWYIGQEASGYRVSTTNRGANETRKAKLRKEIHKGPVDPDSISPKVRKLIHIEVEPPEWLGAELLIADLEVGSDQRAPWRRSRTTYRWQLLSDARIAVNEQTMTHLNPKIATITELP